MLERRLSALEGVQVGATCWLAGRGCCLGVVSAVSAVRTMALLLLVADAVVVRKSFVPRRLVRLGGGDILEDVDMLLLT